MSDARDRIGWPEAMGITAALALLALVASGWVDAMLPWAR
ncbi:hypothetical protein KRMM14A1004_34190 [Krasilnikovia sp. MM14-A1004]